MIYISIYARRFQFIIINESVTHAIRLYYILKFSDVEFKDYSGILNWRKIMIKKRKTAYNKNCLGITIRHIFLQCLNNKMMF